MLVSKEVSASLRTPSEVDAVYEGVHAQPSSKKYENKKIFS